MRIMALDARNYASLMEQHGIKQVSDLVGYTHEDLKSAFKMRKQHREKLLTHLKFLSGAVPSMGSPRSGSPKIRNEEMARGQRYKDPESDSD